MDHRGRGGAWCLPGASMVPGVECCRGATFAPSERITPIKSRLTIAMPTGFSAAVGPP